MGNKEERIGKWVPSSLLYAPFFLILYISSPPPPKQIIGVLLTYDINGL